MILGAGQYANYQPLPWLDLKKVKRGTSSFERWKLIKKDIDRDIGTFLDIGANVGFFSIQLALDGHTVIAVDFQKNLQLIFEYAVRKAGVNNVGYMTGAITPDNISNYPKTDFVLLLSVWHHWVKVFGLNSARDMLIELIKNTDKKIYFESGDEDELSLIREEYGISTMREFLISLPGVNKVTKLGSTTKREGYGLMQPRSLYALILN